MDFATLCYTFIVHVNLNVGSSRKHGEHGYFFPGTRWDLPRIFGQENLIPKNIFHNLQCEAPQL